jgi:hypothetical protein
MPVIRLKNKSFHWDVIRITKKPLTIILVAFL